MSDRGRVELFDRCLVVLWRKVCVPDCHGNCFVPRKLLDRSQVNALHYQSANERVAKIVPAETAYSCLFHRQFKPSSRVVEVAAKFRLTDASIVGASFVQSFKRLNTSPVHGYLPAAAVLCLFQTDTFPTKGDLRPLETVLLALAHAGVQGNVEFLDMVWAPPEDHRAEFLFLVLG